MLLFWFGITIGNAQYTSIPDANFEAALEALGYDDISADGQVPTANIEAVTELNVRSKSISDLTGIEAFINLETLNASENSITGSLDLTANAKLVNVYVFDNQLTSIDVSNLSLLEDLNVSTNDLITLDVSTNTALRELRISYTDIASLDVTDLTNLEEISAFRISLLTTVTLKNNTALRSISASRCNLSGLDFSECPGLEIASLSRNNFTAVDFRTNPLLTDVNLSENQLTSLDLRTGNTAAFTNIDLEDNPNLTCVSIDDPVYATKLLGEELDEQTSYSKACGTYTFIPDDNFEAVLYTLGIDDTSNDNHVLNTRAASVNSLDVSTSGITDLTGIAAFTALTSLNINENQVQEIDLSSNVLLQNLDVSENLLQVLDLSMLPNLLTVNVQQNLLFDFNLKNGNNTNITGFSADSNADLICILVDNETFANTNFTNIDVQTGFSSTTCGTVYTAIPDSNFENGLSTYDDIPNDGKVPRLAIYNAEFINITGRSIADVTGIEDFVNIERIDLARNSISTIDLSNNLKLRELEIDDNNLTALDLTKNVALRELDLDDNNISAIDLSQNVLLKILDLEDNFNLAAIDLTNNVALEELNLSDTNITTLDLSKNIALVEFEFDDPKVPHIDLSNNILLEDIEFDGAPLLESVNLTGLTKLDYFYIEESQMSTIDFSTNTALEELEFYETNVTSLDFSNNLALEGIYLSDNASLTQIIFADQTYPVLDELDTDDTPLESIDVSNMPDLGRLEIRNTNIKSLDLSLNPVLERLYANNAQLEFLNAQNGNNTNFDYFEIDGNPNLYCVQVDDVSYANANFTDKDVQTSFSEDCIAPIITLTGDNPQEIVLGAGYTELGATTDDGSTVVIDATDFVDAIGSYTIRYNATDAFGNMATEVTRMVNVVDPCPLFNMPVTNFNITTSSETCEAKNNGTLSITAVTALAYRTTVNSVDYDFTSSLTVDNLSPGTYPICITVEGFSNCEQCFEAVIEGAEKMAGKTTVSANEMFVEVETGTAPYMVWINSELVGSYNTNSFSLEIEHGDKVEVVSSLDCEGKLTTQISLLDNVSLSPNPTQGDITLNLGNTRLEKVRVAMYNALGVEISSKSYSVGSGSILLPTSGLSQGIYFVKVDDTATFKIVKQ